MCYYSICLVELSIRYAQNLNGSLNLKFSKVPDFNNTVSSQLLSQYSVLIAKHISWRNVWRMWDSWSSNRGSFISIVVSAILISTKEKKGRKISPRREAEITSAFHIPNNMNNIYIILPHTHPVCSIQYTLHLYTLCCLILSIGALCWQQTRKFGGEKKGNSFFLNY